MDSVEQFGNNVRWAAAEEKHRFRTCYRQKGSLAPESGTKGISQQLRRGANSVSSNAESDLAHFG